ncbi:MAG: homoserine kinase [Proteobacteria bacterium]|nr:homoserine kinase [Pseudomonadota bacterium]
MEVLAARCTVRKTSRHDNGVADPGTLRALMEVLAARCAVRKTSRHDNGVADPGTLRALNRKQIERTMAVFTHFEQSALERYLTMYGLGTLVSFEAIGAGIENSNYFVTLAKDSEPAEFVLTIIENHSFAEVPFFSRIMRHLFYFGLPVSAPKQTLDGMTSTIFCGKPTMLFPRLEGTHIDAAEARHCRQVGQILGTMHATLATEDAHRDNPYSDQWMSDTLATGLPDDTSLSDADRTTLQLLASEYEAAQELALPRGIIHGDLFKDNVLFAGDELTGVLDFYHSCTDFLIQDVAICINAWCTGDDGRIEPDKRQALLDGYQSERELSDAEVEYLPLFQKFAAARFAVTRLLSGEPGEPLKDPEEFLALLRHFNE